MVGFKIYLLHRRHDLTFIYSNLNIIRKIHETPTLKSKYKKPHKIRVLKG